MRGSIASGAGENNEGMPGSGFDVVDVADRLFFRQIAGMKKSPVAKKSAKAKTTKPATKVKAAKAVKRTAKKLVTKAPATKARKTSTRKQPVAFALDPRLVPCGCCPGMCGGDDAMSAMAGKRGGKRKGR